MSLQAEIDAAASGATLTLPAGTHGPLILRTSLTLVGDPFGTVLDGGKQQPVIRVAGEGIRVQLSGLTLRNGASQAGGGILFEQGALLVIEECTLQGNAAHAYGGGAIYARGEQLQLLRSKLLENVGRQGGGLLVDALCRATVTSTLIARNRAVLGGGVRAVEGASLVLEGCTVAENAVQGEGAGSQVHTAGTMSRRPSLTLRNCIVAGPRVALWNAGAYPSEVEVEKTLLPPEEAAGWGSGALPGLPRFVGSGPQPYALAPGSPGLGAGDPQGVPASARDLVGAPRLSGNGRLDLGALSSR